MSNRLAESGRIRPCPQCGSEFMSRTYRDDDDGEPRLIENRCMDCGWSQFPPEEPPMSDNPDAGQPVVQLRPVPDDFMPLMRLTTQLGKIVYEYHSDAYGFDLYVNADSLPSENAKILEKFREQIWQAEEDAALQKRLDEERPGPVMPAPVGIADLLALMREEVDALRDIAEALREDDRVWSVPALAERVLVGLAANLVSPATGPGKMALVLDALELAELFARELKKRQAAADAPVI